MNCYFNFFLIKKLKNQFKLDWNSELTREIWIDRYMMSPKLLRVLLKRLWTKTVFDASLHLSNRVPPAVNQQYFH